MKNMKVSKKLTLGFAIAILLPSIMAIGTLVGLRYVNNASTRMYEQYSRPLSHLAYAVEYLQEMRYLASEYIIATSVITNEHDTERISAYGQRVDELVSSLNRRMDIFAPALTDPVEISMYNNARQIIDNEYIPFLRRAHSFSLERNPVAILNEKSAVAAQYDKALGTLDDIYAARVDLAAEAARANTALYNSFRYSLIPLLFLGATIGTIFAIYISKSVGKPMSTLSELATLMGRDGDITVSPEKRAILDTYDDRKDEVGEIFRGMEAVIGYMNECCGELQLVSGGDLTVDVNIRSEKDLLSKSVKNMVESLHYMFSEITDASAQVSAGALQIAGGAQILAQGSTEQAATVQQLSASTAEISKKTKENAKMADKATQLAKIIKECAEKGSRQMDEMVDAVGEIHTASQSISNVIKVIDDIAFQTNILALNAAVEAARAGQYGTGFAVVADEVRRLAAKSSEAAKDTGVLISNTMEKAEYGAHIAKETAASLAEIVEGINQSSDIIHDIAEASEKQAYEITHIDTGIDQVATVVQQNSSVAQESAAASQELSGQSETLRGMLAKFKLDNSDDYTSELPVYAN